MVKWKQIDVCVKYCKRQHLIGIKLCPWNRQYFSGSSLKCFFSVHPSHQTFSWTIWNLKKLREYFNEPPCVCHRASELMSHAHSCFISALLPTVDYFEGCPRHRIIVPHFLFSACMDFNLFHPKWSVDVHCACLLRPAGLPFLICTVGVSGFCRCRWLQST